MEIPPPVLEVLPEPENIEPTWPSSDTLSANDAISALRNHVKKQSCWGEWPIEKFEVQSVEPSTAYKYEIETWTEKRTVLDELEPYFGGVIDSSEHQNPPAPWSIQVKTPPPFKKEQFSIKIPHTEYTEICHACAGRGKDECFHCRGSGRVACTSCKIVSESEPVEGALLKCENCEEMKLIKCENCEGSGVIACETCKGATHVKKFKMLKVEFEKHDDEYVVEGTDLPNKYIENAKGVELFKQTANRIYPITSFYIQEINSNSQRLVDKHAQKWPMEQILSQKQTLDSIPVYEVKYLYKEDNTNGRFWIYGNEHAVFIEEYPATCCCYFKSCSVM